MTFRSQVEEIQNSFLNRKLHADEVCTNIYNLFFETVFYTFEEYNTCQFEPCNKTLNPIGEAVYCKQHVNKLQYMFKILKSLAIYKYVDDDYLFKEQSFSRLDYDEYASDKVKREFNDFITSVEKQLNFRNYYEKH